MQGLIVVTCKIKVMNIFYYPKPLSVKVFVLFACIKVLQAIADYYLGFDKSVIDFQKSFGAYLPNSILSYPIFGQCHHEHHLRCGTNVLHCSY